MCPGASEKYQQNLDQKWFPSPNLYVNMRASMTIAQELAI